MQLTISLEPSYPERIKWRSRELRVGELLGAGAFSSVHAVTVQPPPKDGLPHEMAAKITSIGSKDEEAAHLTDTIIAHPHPHIVRVFGSMIVEQRWRVVLLERAYGGELFDRVRMMDGGFDERIAARWCGELLSAVGHLHELGIAHR